MQNHKSKINNAILSLFNDIFIDELEVNLVSIKKIHQFEQVLTTNQNPCRKLQQSFRGINSHVQFVNVSQTNLS